MTGRVTSVVRTEGAGSPPSSARPARAGPVRHPGGVYLLAGVEFWERFSYYGLSGLLVLYLSAAAGDGGLGWSRDDAVRLFGIYGGLAFAAPVAGGYIASRWWGDRRCIALGGSGIMAGHILLGIHALLPADGTLKAPALYVALLLVALGTGLLKPAISAAIGRLYPEGSPNRQAGFTIFMVCIWAGSLSANLIAGTLGERLGWHYGFSVAALGMAVGLACYALLVRRLLGTAGLSPQPAPTSALAAADQPHDRQRIRLICTFSALTLLYALAFYQKGGLLNLIIQGELDRSVGAFTVPATWFLSISTACFILAAPLFGRLWQRLGEQGRDPDVLQKQAMALILMALAYLLMWQVIPPAGGPIGSAGWMAAVYALFGLADVFIWPVQLSAVTALAPKHRTSFFVGLWWVATGIGTFLTGFVAGLESLLGRSQLFLLIAGCLIVGAGLALAARRRFAPLLQQP